MNCFVKIIRKFVLIKNFSMKLEDVNIKSILALFIIIFGMIAMVFVDMEDMVLGAIIGFIGFPLGYFFGSSKGTEAKDKVISDMTKNAQDTDQIK